jgi:hypothetical protein
MCTVYALCLNPDVNIGMNILPPEIAVTCFPFASLTSQDC